MKRKIITILLLSTMGVILLGCGHKAAAVVPAPGATAVVSEPAPDATHRPTVTPEIQYFDDASEGPLPVIFSHDGAPDDVATLVYISKHPRVKLLGVIQSYGEQHPQKSLQEWQIFLYDVLDLDDVPIGVGAEDPLDPARNEFPAGWRSGADNFWGVSLPAASQDYTAENGANLIVRLVNESPEKVVILVTGAQTDLALALQQDPGIADNIAQVVIMGGAFNRDGNLNESPGYENNHVAEWNIFVDPLAAKQVFNSGIPLSIVSLDGSDEFIISQEDYDKMAGSDDPALQLLERSWRQNFNNWGGDFKIWDIVAGVAMTNPGYFTWTYDGVDVIAETGDTHGQTIRLDNSAKNTRFTAITSYVGVRKTIFDVLK